MLFRSFKSKSRWGGRRLANYEDPTLSVVRTKSTPLWANLGVRRRTVSEPTSTEKDHNNNSWPETESETEQQAISGLEGRSRLGRGLAHITVRPNVLTQYIPRFLSTSLINCNTVVVDRWAKG